MTSGCSDSSVVFDALPEDVRFRGGILPAIMAGYDFVCKAPCPKSRSGGLPTAEGKRAVWKAPFLENARAEALVCSRFAVRNARCARHSLTSPTGRRLQKTPLCFC